MGGAKLKGPIRNLTQEYLCSFLEFPAQMDTYGTVRRLLMDIYRINNRFFMIINLQQVSPKMLRILFFSAFHLSAPCTLFFLFKGTCDLFSKSKTDIRAMDLYLILFLAALVMFVTEVLPPKGAVTRFISRCHSYSFMNHIAFYVAITIVAQELLGQDGFGLPYVVLVTSFASFLASYAAEEVSYAVTRTLWPVVAICAYRSFFHLSIYMDKVELKAIVANGCALWVTSIVNVNRLGELRYTDKEPDAIISNRVSV